MRTSPPLFGVEEEFLLLDPTTCRPVARADQVLEALASPSASRRGYLPQRELLQAQLEIATDPCRSLDQARSALEQARFDLSEAAEACGAVLAPLGTAPWDGADPVPVTARERYQDLARATPALVEEQLINGMHVHVEVPARAAGITVMNRLRPWLHVLLALSANSPLWRGRDTGFASWRTVHARRWPTHGPPPVFANAQEYDRRTAALVQRQVIRDVGQLYWSVRLSERYPTVEVRVCDVQLDVDSAVMLAGLIRALVARALRDAAIGVAEPMVSREAVEDATWHAARHGTAGALLDLSRRGPDYELRPAMDLTEDLLRHIAPSREDELDDVMPTLAAVLSGAGGAQRQRRAMATAGIAGVADLARRSCGLSAAAAVGAY